MLLVLLAGVVPAPAQADDRGAAIAAVAVHPWRLDGDPSRPPFWPIRDPGLREQAFAALQRTGIKTARVEMRWDAVEPTLKGLRDWSEFDALHASAQAHGIKLLPMVAMPPAWANGGRGVWSYPDNPQDFEDFLTAAIQRYPDIGAWEIWNEPNYDHFSKPTIDVRKFVELLAAAHRAKQRAGSNAAIISGGLCSCGSDPAAFFEDMVRLNAFDYVDGFAIHAYSSLRPDADGSFFLGLPHYHQRLTEIGRPNVGVWVTEYGAPNSTRASDYGPAFDEAEQAVRLSGAFAVAARWPWIRSLTWYELEDLCPDAADVECHFGLFRPDMSPKPAQQALARIAAGDLPRIAARVVLKRRRGTRRPALRGALYTPTAEPASGQVTLRIKRGKQGRTLRLRVVSGSFAATLPRSLRPGVWRVTALYAGTADHAPATSNVLSFKVKRGRRSRLTR